MKTISQLRYARWLLALASSCSQRSVTLQIIDCFKKGNFFEIFKSSLPVFQSVRTRKKDRRSQSANRVQCFQNFANQLASKLKRNKSYYTSQTFPTKLVNHVFPSSSLSHLASSSLFHPSRSTDSNDICPIT